MRESFFKENEYYKGSIHFFHLFESQNKLTTVYKIVRKYIYYTN